MTDPLSKNERSRLMSRIGPKNSKPEMAVRRLAHRLGYRFRLHRRELPGKPDLVFPSRRSIIFVHGCFWHRHRECRNGAYMPKTRTEFWRIKLEGNAERDMRNLQSLAEMGWRCLVIWECETRDAGALTDRLRSFLN
jgi:DNA mismatch endonuclease, patch repair protein